MSITQQLQQATQQAVKAIYNIDLPLTQIAINATKPEFEGDYTIVLFAFVKQLKQNPDTVGNALGQYLTTHFNNICVSYNLIKGFLNITIADSYWLHFISVAANNENYGKWSATNNKVMVEYSSPNTNKPLHLGHLRNNFIGWSTAEILKFAGNDVVKTCVVNDRGVHICKSMLAWKKFGNGATPTSTNTKGDKLVGYYYVLFENALKAESDPIIAAIENGDVSRVNESDALKATQLYQKLQDGTLTEDKRAEIKAAIKEIARNSTAIMQEVRQMLIDWEAGKPDVIELWKTMNQWVYDGFEATYKTIGSDFDTTYYESNTYLLGKDLVEQGLAKGVFYTKADGSVWIDLTADGLDEKLVRRKDGTSVYITQDIGLAELKQQQYGCNESIYVVGDEQNYHFKVLKLICQKLGLPSADGIYHLSYGMVELPSGKMKSREGTVVDADDLVDEMIAIAEAKTRELGKVDDFTAEELQALYHMIGLGALKFFLLRVDPKKKITFNPEESIEMQGFTGPFIQYTHARIKSILRKAGDRAATNITAEKSLLPLEKALAVQLETFPSLIQEAAQEHDPSKIAHFAFTLAQTFNSFYVQHSISNAESDAKKALRLQLATLTATTLKNAMHMLGIKVPERM
ncbi:MAG: arginine--tRNA ligase [Chitinophagaceae bacterium]